MLGEDRAGHDHKIGLAAAEPVGVVLAGRDESDLDAGSLDAEPVDERVDEGERGVVAANHRERALGLRGIKRAAGGEDRLDPPSSAPATTSKN
jgi:hypothetical protein